MLDICTVVWIDAADDLDSIWGEINAMLEQSPTLEAEEYAIHDYEGFGGYKISEYESINDTHKIACFIEESPDFDGELLNYCSGLDEAREVADECYSGCYTSMADYAQDFTEQTGDVPKHLEFYVGYERMGKDMEMSGDILTIETAHDEIHVFWND